MNLRGKLGLLLSKSPFASKIIRSLLQPRKFQVYCIGAPKTGTVSIANIFSYNFRTKHEPTYIEFARLIEMRRNGKIEENELIHWISRRDSMLWLELESSHPMAWFCDILNKKFPYAKFILPIRDCYSWLDSIINQHLNFQWQKESMNLRDIFFNNGSEYESLLLKNLNLYSIDGYLSYWASHNNFVLDSVPEDRLLVMPTHQIKARIIHIAKFVGVSVADLSQIKAHSNKAKEKHYILKSIDTSLIISKIVSICGPVIERLSKYKNFSNYDLIDSK